MTNAYLFLEGFVKACFFVICHLSFVILDCHASPFRRYLPVNKKKGRAVARPFY
jgi:hypothetical protein